MWECPDFAEPGDAPGESVRAGEPWGLMASHRDQLIGLGRQGMDGARRGTLGA